MRNIHIIIPARFESTRFPGKPLKKIGDKKLPEKLGISAGKDLLKKAEGYYKKKR